MPMLAPKTKQNCAPHYYKRILKYCQPHQHKEGSTDKDHHKTLNNNNQYRANNRVNTCSQDKHQYKQIPETQNTFKTVRNI